jgi:hypothetical protein
LNAREREERPRPHDEPVEDEGELHRLWSPQQLEELRDSKRRYAAGRRLAALASDVMSKRITDETIVRRLRQLADWYDGAEKARKPKAEQKPLIDDVRTVFDHWVKVSGRKRSKLDEKRRKMIKARLEDFTVDDLKRVIELADGDDFWGGAKARKGKALPIESYMKEHCLVENLLHGDDGQQMLFAGGDAEDDDEIEELEERAARLREEGRIDDANEIEADIRRRMEARRADR